MFLDGGGCFRMLHKCQLYGQAAGLPRDSAPTGQAASCVQLCLFNPVEAAVLFFKKRPEERSVWFCTPPAVEPCHRVDSSPLLGGSHPEAGAWELGAVCPAQIFFLESCSFCFPVSAGQGLRVDFCCCCKLSLPQRCHISLVFPDSQPRS